MQPTKDRIPNHLKKYIVDQKYSKYTSVDQAVWRYILRQLKFFLKDHAHKAYLSGLAKSGISEDEIPRIEIMDKMLNEFGWGAVPISGFIPPAAFMEFQSLSILPIATDLRTLDHILYTPAPDIVHESAGHAPILIDKDFSRYLKEYATIASKAIFSKEDLEIYEAIRELSDIKEDSESTDEQIQACEKRLDQATKSIRYVSEASLLSRMNWWTAEYGLIGDLDDPKIFGAGLLSSVGEAQSCLSEKVKKIPLTLKCIETNYDITEKQPQLFVTNSFQNLIDVLHELAETMAYKRGGFYGLERALESETVNTVELNSGLQISGLLTECHGGHDHYYLQFSGPSQLSLNYNQLIGHDPEFHKEGYGSPVGYLKNEKKCLHDFNSKELKRIGLEKGQSTSLEFQSGVVVNGTVKEITFNNSKPILISFTNCTVTKDKQILFKPEWGQYDMAVGSKITSVFGGPADRENYGELIDFVAKILPDKKYTLEQKNLHQFYSDIRSLRAEFPDRETFKNRLQDLCKDYFENFSTHWLAGVELYELALLESELNDLQSELKDHLLGLSKNNTENKNLIADGLKLAHI
jgi:phenylalanine-4-hydroxylase